MLIGEVCDKSLNDRANQDGRERHSSKSMAGTAFMEAAKTGESRFNEIYRQKVLPNTLRSVTLYGEQSLLNCVTFHTTANNHAKPQNRPCHL